MSHRYAGGANVTHTLRTYRTFSSRLLKNGNAVTFGFDIDNDSRIDRLGVVLWLQGRLRGVLADARGRLITLVPVSRPSSRAVAMTLPVRFHGDAGQYRWVALTLYKAKKGCAKTCTDLAPNHGLILNKLWELDELSVNISGSGRVRSLQSGIDCPTRCSARYRRGTSVTLEATPAAGWSFAGWGGACSGVGSCVVTTTSTTSVTATFLPLYSLSVTSTGPSYVTVVPPDRPCSGATPCNLTYVSGATVTLTAATGNAYLFDGWSGACTGTNPVCTLTMDGNKSVTAHTRIRPSSLSVSLALASGADGRVLSAPTGIDCPGDCSETYTTETYVTLTATAGPGSVFAGWTNSIWCQGASATCQLQIWPGGDGDRAATASFAVAP